MPKRFLKSLAKYTGEEKRNSYAISSTERLGKAIKYFAAASVQAAFFLVRVFYGEKHGKNFARIYVKHKKFFLARE